MQRYQIIMSQLG